LQKYKKERNVIEDKKEEEEIIKED